jgi:hypothetical protein
MPTKINNLIEIKKSLTESKAKAKLKTRKKITKRRSVFRMTDARQKRYLLRELLPFVATGILFRTVPKELADGTRDYFSYLQDTPKLIRQMAEALTEECYPFLKR